MHLLLFTGFLGSGKTSVIIPLAKAAAAAGRKVAILVNEIGEIGIDNQLMRQLGLNMWELVAGCICCTLSADLVSTLKQVEAEYAPELVVVEASGAADPSRILELLPHYRGRPLAGVRTVTMIDPLRLEMLLEVLTPLITSQIACADIIIISKADMAAPAVIAYSIDTARAINPRARIITPATAKAADAELLRTVMP